MQPDRNVVIEMRNGEVQRVYARTALWLNVTVVNLDTNETEQIDTHPLDAMPRELRAQVKS